MSNNESDQIYLSKIAYNTGFVRAQLENIKEDLRMGSLKEALNKVNCLSKFMDTEMVPEFNKSKIINKEGNESEKDEKSSEDKPTSNDHNDSSRDISENAFNA